MATDIKLLIPTDVRNALLGASSPSASNVYMTASAVPKAIGQVVVTVTFVQSGADYYARFSTPIINIGNAADFTIISGTPTTSDQLICSKTILQCSASYFFQFISQTGANSLSASLFGGVPSATGGRISVPLSINNARMSHQLDLGYVAPNSPITSSLNWSGVGTVTTNSARLTILYLQ